MLKNLSLLLVAFLASLSMTAYAAHNGGGGGMPGGMSGGMSASHISGAGLHNTNGPDALDRDKGKARAADRHDIDAAKHEKAKMKHGNHMK